jgi:hypothetical protein
LRDKRVMGAPDIKPERSTFMPVMKQIPQANRPPQKIVNRIADERGKNNRPDQLRTERNLPAGPKGSITRNGQTNGRIIELPQSPDNGSQRPNIMPPQTPKLPDNTRPITPLRPIGPPIAPQVQPPRGEDRPVTPEKPRDPHESRVPLKPNDIRQSIPPKNIIKEPLPQAVPARPAPDRKIEAPDRTIDPLKKNPEVPANEQRVRTEVRQQQNPKPMENVILAPPVRPDSQAATLQPLVPTRKTEDSRITQKPDPDARTNPSGNTAPDQNKNEFKRDVRSDMEQRRR